MLKINVTPAVPKILCIALLWVTLFQVQTGLRVFHLQGNMSRGPFIVNRNEHSALNYLIKKSMRAELKLQNARSQIKRENQSKSFVNIFYLVLLNLELCLR